MAYTITVDVIEPQVIVNEAENTVTINNTTTEVVVNTNASIFYQVPVPGATGPIGPGYDAGVQSVALYSSAFNTSTGVLTLFFGGTNATSYRTGDYVRAIGYYDSTSTGYIEGPVTVLGQGIGILDITIQAMANTINEPRTDHWSIGLSGTPGLYAAMGATGPQGPAGTNGTNGTNGSTGATGLTGATGPAGSGANSDQSLYTTSSVAFASINLGGVVNTGVSYSDISGTSPVTLDTWSSTSVRSAEYFVQVSDSDDYHIEKITLLATGSDVFFDEYGIVYTTSLGTFTATQDVANVSLIFTPNSAVNMSIRVAITQMAV